MCLTWALTIGSPKGQILVRDVNRSRDEDCNICMNIQGRIPKCLHKYACSLTYEMITGCIDWIIRHLIRGEVMMDLYSLYTHRALRAAMLDLSILQGRRERKREKRNIYYIQSINLSYCYSPVHIVHLKH